MVGEPLEIIWNLAIARSLGGGSIFSGGKSIIK